MTLYRGRARRAELPQRHPAPEPRSVQLIDPELRTAFRRFYVWCEAGLWHARPLPKVTAIERARRIAPELTAESLISLAILCIWHRNRRASVGHF
ncbi:hypothetical protein SAMN05421874_1462 [Nonomuraea maritima]|uniref:Uncharacterized protein n=1 Tax=Nonomuraea maritima TaxID=683260 RepID=A0A1G9RHP2_9ACTN|nr:hypothetical protein SAMN05421874_1462 [Nonomuraea maritima]